MPPRDWNEATPELRKRASLNLEEILTSRSRIKILKALAMKRSMNISGLKKSTGLNYKSIARALEALKYMRVVGETHLDRTRNFRIKVENEEASTVDRLIRNLESLERDSTKKTEKESPRSTETATHLTTKYKEPNASASAVE